MRGISLVPSNVTRTLICVNDYRDSDLSGLLYNPFMPEPLEFDSAYKIVYIMEDFFDKIAYPQAYYQDRAFMSQKSRSAQQKRSENEVRQYMSDDIFTTERGKKATFVVQVQFRQNATWQGTITWTEEKKQQRFRSTLEMIKLMDGALSEDSDDTVVWE